MAACCGISGSWFVFQVASYVVNNPENKEMYLIKYNQHGFIWKLRRIM